MPRPQIIQSSAKPLDYNSLRSTLLQREKSHVERLMEPIRGYESKRGSPFAVMDARMCKGDLLLISWWSPKVA